MKAYKSAAIRAGKMVQLGSNPNPNMFKISSIKSGVIDSNDGTINQQESISLKYHDYIDCNPGDSIYINYFGSLIYGTRESFSVFFYSENKTFISSLTHTDDLSAYIAPANAKYFMFRTDLIYWGSAPQYEYAINVYNLKVYINKEIPSDTLTNTQITSRYSNVFFVNDYYNESLTDSEVVDLALADANLLTTRTIVFGDRNWLVSKAVLLKSGTTVLINNCRIKQANLTFDNIFRGDNLVINESDPYGFPTSINDLSNIKIHGYGNAILNGNDVNKQAFHPFKEITEDMVGDNWGLRTLMISFSKATNIEIRNIGMAQTKCYAMSFDRCQNISINKITQYTNVKNGDGIDIRFGCKNVVIKDIYNNCTDDCIALNANCFDFIPTYPLQEYVYPLEPSFAESAQLVDRTVLDIENVNISNIICRSDSHGLILLQENNLEIKNISVSKMTIFDTLYGTTGGIYVYQNGNADKIHAVDISDITCYEGKTVVIETKVTDFNLTRLVNLYPGGVNLYSSNLSFIEDVIITNSTP